MQQRKSLLMLILGAFFIAGCGDPLSSGKIIAQVNSKKITEGHLEFLSTLNPAIGRQLATPFGRKQVVDNLVEQELLYQAAKRNGIHRDPKVKAKIDLYQKIILAESFIHEKALAEAKTEYEENQGEFEKLKFSHIMIRFANPQELKAKNEEKVTRSENQALSLAKQILARAQKGEDFVALADQYSEDLGSKSHGGDLGFSSRKEAKLMRRGFEPLLEKAFEMKVGEIAGPIKTALGYHVITVTAPAELPSFEQIQDQLVLRTKRNLRQQLLADLKKNNNVVYNESLEANPQTEGQDQQFNSVPEEQQKEEQEPAEKHDPDHEQNHDH